MSEMDIKVFADARELFQFAADDFGLRVRTALKTQDTFSVVLSGGSTPKLFFDTLANNESHQKNIPWDQIHFYFGDERYVPSTDEASNYHMAQEHLFAKLPIKSENIFRMPTEFLDPNEAANVYARTLENIKFDLVYLGLGDDAHTASLMPQSCVVADYIDNALANYANPLVAALYVEKFKMYRLTLTPHAINQGTNIIFLVTGADKASAVSEVLCGELNALNYPAQLIHSIHGKTIWYLDQAAAKKIHAGNENE